MVMSLALAISISTLGACTFYHPQPAGEPVSLVESDVVGTWQRQQTGEVMTFAPDGSFVATNLPYQLFTGFFEDSLPPGFNPDQDKLPASGEWLLGPAGQSDDEPKYLLILLPDTIAGLANRDSFELRPEIVSNTLVISFYIGDPDLRNRIVYERCEGTCHPHPSWPGH
jgi:hypothetical protein